MKLKKSFGPKHKISAAGNQRQTEHIYDNAICAQITEMAQMRQKNAYGLLVGHRQQTDGLISRKTRQAGFIKGYPGPGLL